MVAVALIYCERCRAPIDAGGPDLNRLHALTGLLREGRPALDLCPACAAELKRWIAEGAERSAGPKGIC